MPLPRREQVLAALATALATAQLDGQPVAVQRNRRRPVAAADCPALVMVDGGHEPPDYDAPHLARYRMSVTVEGYVAPASEAAIGPAISDLHAAILLAALADPTLGGLADDIREGAMTVALDEAPGRDPAAALALDLIIDYVTAPADPYS